MRKVILWRIWINFNAFEIGKVDRVYLRDMHFIGMHLIVEISCLVWYIIQNDELSSTINTSNDFMDYQNVKQYGVVKVILNITKLY